MGERNLTGLTAFVNKYLGGIVGMIPILKSLGFTYKALRKYVHGDFSTFSAQLKSIFLGLHLPEKENLPQLELFFGIGYQWATGVRPETDGVNPIKRLEILKLFTRNFLREKIKEYAVPVVTAYKDLETYSKVKWDLLRGLADIDRPGPDGGNNLFTGKTKFVNYDSQEHALSMHALWHVPLADTIQSKIDSIENELRITPSEMKEAHINWIETGHPEWVALLDQFLSALRAVASLTIPAMALQRPGTSEDESALKARDWGQVQNLVRFYRFLNSFFEGTRIQFDSSQLRFPENDLMDLSKVIGSGLFALPKEGDSSRVPDWVVPEIIKRHGTVPPPLPPRRGPTIFKPNFLVTPPTEEPKGGKEE